MDRREANGKPLNGSFYGVEYHQVYHGLQLDHWRGLEDKININTELCLMVE